MYQQNVKAVVQL